MSAPTPTEQTFRRRLVAVSDSRHGVTGCWVARHRTDQRCRGAGVARARAAIVVTGSQSSTTARPIGGPSAARQTLSIQFAGARLVAVDTRSPRALADTTDSSVVT